MLFTWINKTQKAEKRFFPQSLGEHGSGQMCVKILLMLMINMAGVVLLHRLMDSMMKIHIQIRMMNTSWSQCTKVEAHLSLTSLHGLQDGASLIGADGLKAYYWDLLNMWKCVQVIPLWDCQRIWVIITVYELIIGRPGCVNKWELRVNRNITDVDILINSSTTKLLSHSTGSICNLKEPGGGNILLI